MILYLCGVPRSGKTTTSQELHKKIENSSLIVSEAVRNGFQKIDPNPLNPWGKQTSHERQNLFPLFVKEFLEWNEKFSNSTIIFDCALIPIETIFKNKRTDDKVICLGFGGLENQEILKLVRQHEEGQYTTEFSNVKLLKIWGDISKQDKENFEFCKEHNIPYFNTSKNREDVIKKVLNTFNK